MKLKSMAADLITLSRIAVSLPLLLLPMSRGFFTALYIFCGITDMLDGSVARKLHTESKRGAVLDSAADLCFAAVCAVRVLPSLHLPRWVWIWVAVIAAAKVAGIVISSVKACGFMIEHSIGNKITGLLVFLLPLTAFIVDVKYPAVFVCAAATAVVIGEIIKEKETVL